MQAPTRLITAAQIVAMALIVLAFVPFIGGSAGDQGLNAQRAVELSLLCAGVGITVAIALSYRLTQPLVGRWTGLLLGGFVLWALATAAWSKLPVLSAAKAVELGMVIFAAALISRWATWERLTTGRLATLMGLAMTGSLVIMFAANVAMHGSTLVFNTESTRNRLVLAEAHPLQVADLAALALVCVVASRFPILLKVAAAGLAAAVLVMAQGRGAFAATPIALLAMAVCGIRRRDIRLLTCLVLALAFVGILLAYGQQIWHLLDNGVGDDAATLNGRTVLWEYTLPLIGDRPLGGHGYYASRALLLDAFTWAGHTHNAYLELALGTGLIGAALLLALTLHILRVACRTLDPLLIGLGTYCYVVGMLDPLLLTPGAPTLLLLTALMRAEATVAHPWPRRLEYCPVNEAAPDVPLGVRLPWDDPVSSV